MWRLARFVALAAVAISLAAATGNHQPSAQRNEAAELERGSTPIADAVREIRPEKDVACEDREDKRSNDLCAQWKAVDAANNAARATWAAVFFSFVGTVLIAATFWETRKTSRRELRAYVDIEGKELNFNVDTDTVTASMMVINTGKTPAFRVRWAGNVSITTDDKLEACLKQPGLTKLPVPAPPCVTVGSGRESLAGIKGTDTFDIEEFKAALGDGPDSVFVHGRVWYEDAFKRKRYADFCRRCVKMSGGAEDFLAFEVTPFHNDSD